jgi:hypothetical protein
MLRSRGAHLNSGLIAEAFVMLFDLWYRLHYIMRFWTSAQCRLSYTNTLHIAIKRRLIKHIA